MGADDLLSILDPHKLSPCAGGGLGEGANRATQRVPGRADRQEVIQWRLARGVLRGADAGQEPLVERDRPDNLLAIAKFEDPLDRVSVAGRCRKVIDADGIGGAEIAEEHDQVPGVSADDGQQLISLAEPHLGKVCDSPHSFHPAIPREEDDSILVDDKSLLAVLGLPRPAPADL